MIIDDVATYIATNITSLTKGTNLFKGFLPDNTDDVVCVYNTGGAESSRDIPTGDPTFQIFIRNKDYETGHTLVMRIYDLLHRLVNEELVSGETYFYNIFALGRPAHLGRDKKGRDEFSVNFIGHIRE